MQFLNVSLKDCGEMLESFDCVSDSREGLVDPVIFVDEFDVFETQLARPEIVCGTWVAPTGWRA